MSLRQQRNGPVGTGRCVHRLRIWAAVLAWPHLQAIGCFGAADEASTTADRSREPATSAGPKHHPHDFKYTLTRAPMYARVSAPPVSRRGRLLIAHRPDLG